MGKFIELTAADGHKLSAAVSSMILPMAVESSL